MSKVEMARQAKLAKVNEFITNMGLDHKEGFNVNKKQTYYDGGWNCDGQLVKGAVTDRRSVMAKL